jgi:hypothetical protein
MTTVTVRTKSGAKVSAEFSIDGGKVMLHQAGAVAGSGRIRYGTETLATGESASWARIEDAAARLGAVDGSETDDAYAALEIAVAEWLGAQVDEATLTDTKASRHARIESAVRLCRAADEEQAVEGDSELTGLASAEQAGTIETMRQACDGEPTVDDWKHFVRMY